MTERRPSRDATDAAIASHGGYQVVVTYASVDKGLHELLASRGWDLSQMPSREDDLPTFVVVPRLAGD